MLEKTKFRLQNFRNKDSVNQRERLNALIADIRGPLRVQSGTVRGEKVLYLGVRTLSQYCVEMFFKHIANMPEKIVEREQKAIDAINTNILPYLRVEPNRDNAIPDQRHAGEIMDKLFQRVCGVKISARYFERKQSCESPLPFFDCDDRKLIATKWIRPSGCISVPKGLSVARIASDKIKADAYICAKQPVVRTGLPQTRMIDDLGALDVDAEAGFKDFSRQSSQTLSSESENDGDNIESSEQDGLSLPEEKDRASEVLTKHYYTLLQDPALNKKTVALELASNDESHWVAAYAAAGTRIETAGKDNMSIMLIPHDPKNNESIDNESSLSDADWLKKRTQQLGLSDQPSKIKSPWCRNVEKVGHNRKRHEQPNRIRYGSDEEIYKDKKDLTSYAYPQKLDIGDSDSDSDSD